MNVEIACRGNPRRLTEKGYCSWNVSRPVLDDGSQFACLGIP